MSFLERLSSAFLKSKTLPYPHERGDLSLRKRLASFLRIYCHTALEPDKIFVAPERRVLLSMILDMVAGTNDSVLISESLHDVYDDLLRSSELSVTACNNDLAEIMELDRALSPKILVLAPRAIESSFSAKLGCSIRSRQNSIPIGFTLSMSRLTSTSTLA